MKIRELYYKIVPYNWRPGQIYYRIKCFCWHRYTTVKPRYLSHEWTDRCELMPHMMFEILSQFIEKECSPGFVDWEYNKHVRDEMQELYDWWHEIFNGLYPRLCDRLWKRAKQHSPTIDWVEIGDFLEYKPKWATEKDRKMHDLYLLAIRDLEDRMGQDLKANLHRIIEIIVHMRT